MPDAVSPKNQGLYRAPVGISLEPDSHSCPWFEIMRDYVQWVNAPSQFRDPVQTGSMQSILQIPILS
jgi:hypothetical protein